MILPTFLSLVRLIVSVTVLPFLILFLVPLQDVAVAKFLVVLFLLLGLTDFFDGYFARKYSQETVLGKLLDPLADKCFVVSSLITFVALDYIYFYYALIIIVRELVITGLRHVASQHNFSIDVSRFGKLKALTQYMYIVYMVGKVWIDGAVGIASLESTLLGLMLFCSIASGFSYCRGFFKNWQRINVSS